MTANQPPVRTDADDSLLPGLVRSGAILGTLFWVFTLLALLGAGGGLNALGPLLIFLVATSIFVVFVLPALLLSFFGGPTGTKVGGGLLLGGLALGVAILGAPMFR
jgi:hypothetical protein